jgi:hypothetical protein
VSYREYEVKTVHSLTAEICALFTYAEIWLMLICCERKILALFGRLFFFAYKLAVADLL